MKVQELKHIQPYVRMIKIKKAIYLEGVWKDIDHVLIYIARGTVDYIMEGVQYHMCEGDFILIPPYMSHLAIKKNDMPLVQYIVHFDFYEDAERMKIPHQSGDGGGCIPEQERILHGKAFLASISNKERDQFEKLFLNMYREFSCEEEGWTVMVKGLAIQLLIMLARSISVQKKGQNESVPKKSKSWKLVENATEYICLHYNEELDNLKISEAVGASPNYLSKLFQDYVGISLHGYVLNYRLERAQKMLQNGKYNITEVALKCGFSSVHAFSKAFKKKRGINPGAYMEMVENGDLAIQEDKKDYNPSQMIYFNQ